MPKPPLPGRELENERDNPCFNCGPRNPLGMQLRYFDDGDVVRARLPSREEYAGWPGSWNAGLLVSALGDLTTWTAWERLAGPVRAEGPITLEAMGSTSLAAPATVEAHTRVDGDRVRVTAECRQDGKTTLRTTANLRRLTPEEARGLVQHLPELPPSLKPAFEARAAEGAVAARGGR